MIHTVALIASILVSCVMGCFTMLSSGETVDSLYYDECVMPQNSVSVLENASFGTENAEISDLSFHTTAADAQLYIYFADGAAYEIQTFSMLLREAFPYEVTCTLYYPDSAGGFDSTRQVDYKLPKGGRQIFITVPKGYYSSLRIDIDNDYTIQDILVSGDLCAGSYSIRSHMTLKRLAIYAALVFLAVETVLFLRKYRHPRPGAPSVREGALRALLVIQAVAVLALITAGLLLVQAGYARAWYWIVMIPLTTLLMGWQISKLKKPKAAVSMPRNILSRTAAFWGAVAVFCGLIGFQWYETARQAPAAMRMPEFRFVFILALCETLLLALLYYRHLFGGNHRSASYADVFPFCIFILGVAYMLVFLPFISPDEMVHYTSGYRFSNIWLGKIGLIGDKRLLMRLEDYAFFAEGGKKQNLNYYLRTIDNLKLFAQNNGFIITDSVIPTNAPFSYLFSGLGIALGRVLNLSGTLTFYLGRMGNLLFFVLAMRYAMKKIPFGETALFSIAMFPMMLQLEATFSYDVVTYCYVTFFVVQVMYIAYSDREVTRKDIYLCAFFAALMAPSKVVFLPLLFMALIIPGERIGRDKREAMKWKLFIILTGFASLIAVAGFIRLFNINSAVGQMMENDKTVHMLTWAHEEGYTFSWIIGHIGETILMYIRTFITLANSYFFQLLGSYLGWLDIYVPYVYMALCFVVFMVSVHIREKHVNSHAPGLIEKLWIALLCLGSMAATMLALMLDWTPLSYNFIHGVQGRYFLPLLVPAIVILSRRSIKVDRVYMKYVALIMTAINIWVSLYVFSQCIIV